MEGTGDDVSKTAVMGRPAPKEGVSRPPIHAGPPWYDGPGPALSGGGSSRGSHSGSKRVSSNHTPTAPEGPALGTPVSPGRHTHSPPENVHARHGTEAELPDGSEPCGLVGEETGRRLGGASCHAPAPQNPQPPAGSSGFPAAPRARKAPASEASSPLTRAASARRGSQSPWVMLLVGPALCGARGTRWGALPQQ